MRIALFGGSFNPPGVHHRHLAEHLSQHFDEVVIIPCGPRPDKSITNDVDPVHRATMADLGFQGLPRVRVELFDLEAQTFTRTHELDAMFLKQGEVWHVVGTDLLQGGGESRSLIHTVWEDGPRLWEDARFAIFKRPGYRIDPGDLPPHHEIFEMEYRGSSSEIREAIFQHEPFAELIPPRVEAYIERHGLYRGVTPPVTTRVPLRGDEKFMVVVDHRNAQAKEIVRQLEGVDPNDAEMILVVGGDGTMLRAIREHWRLRLPFYGINAGHIGYLLNNRSVTELIGEHLVLNHLPLLWVEMEGAEGRRRNALAFNDAWVERATGQTAWLQVRVDGQERLGHLVADGFLISTAAGSSSYAAAMGATPLPLNTPALLLVGSHVLRPSSWRPVVLPLTSMVEVNTLDRKKRTLRGFIDGVPQGEVFSMCARKSNIAAVELAFDPALNPAEKLARLQFPPPE